MNLLLLKNLSVKNDLQLSITMIRFWKKKKNKI